MFPKGLLEKIDSVLCVYLGIETEKVHLNSTHRHKKELAITHTLSFKRHLLKESWAEFSSFSMKQASTEDCEKLGLAMGKAIAKKLVVSFEESPIERT
jgi:hypothetical protein